MGRKQNMQTIAIYDDYTSNLPFGVEPSGSYSFVMDLRRAKLESLRQKELDDLERQEADMIAHAQREVWRLHFARVCRRRRRRLCRASAVGGSLASFVRRSVFCDSSRLSSRRPRND